ncbi:RICIN domain-containing protein [Sphaerisporangium sp. NPDC005289]|uniref:RICIN domain-containing protein n=1 Tax=Sphaerisporangium rhizosphaerae TaxID=2269375 RepID=A0ABW2PA85_9ACTN
MRKLHRIVTLLLATLLAAVSVAAVGQPAQADTTLPVGAFRLLNYGSWKCVEVAPDSAGNLFSNGNRIWQRACDGSPQQSWLLTRATNGPIGGLGTVVRYLFVNQYTGRCLDLKDGNAVDGAIIQQWACNANSTTMLWGLYDDFQSSRQLVNARSADCLDVQGGSLADRAWLQNYHCTLGNPAQHFFLYQ